MASKERKTYTELELEAKINRVVEEGYSTDSDEVAKVQTTVRLGGKFSRGDVSALIANIVTRLMLAFDQAEDPAEVLQDQADTVTEASGIHVVE